MFHRDVMLPDGRVMSDHEVSEIQHMRYGTTAVIVRSFDDETEHLWSIEYGTLDLDLGFDAAEAWVKDRPEMAEVDDERAQLISEIADMLTDEQAEQVPNAYPEWAVGVHYTVGKRVRHDGKLYRCEQAHTSQADYAPDKAPALWVRTSQEGEIPDWVQPTGAHDAYAKGDKVRHNGKVWESTMDANVYEPGVYGWTEA